MTRRLMLAMLGLGLALFVAPRISLAAESHLEQAIEHTKQAIDEGNKGDASALVEHATAALGHAQDAQKEKASPHTKAGIKHLKEAIKHGKKGHAKVATKHAETALTHLEEANK
jgi:hypothetical protein